jgi:hypothetical protein
MHALAIESFCELGGTDMERSYVQLDSYDSFSADVH